MANYVLVHGAWHTGAHLQGVASLIQAMGHDVHTPTIKGNRLGDSKTVGLSEAIESIVEYLEETGTGDGDYGSGRSRSAPDPAPSSLLKNLEI